MLTQHLFLFIILLSCCQLFLATQVRAEAWLTDSTYLESQHLLTLEHKASDKETGFDTLSQVHADQLLGFGKLQLGGKFASRDLDTHVLINEINLVTTVEDLPYFSFTLGRMLVHYRQEDLFNTSLSKNQDRLLSTQDDKERNYSQGLLTQFQLGFIHQALLINHYSDQATSFHYRFNLGVPGYKFGPLQLVLEQLPKDYLGQSDAHLLLLLAGNLQFPFPTIGQYKIPGAWQWSFQLGRIQTNLQAEEKELQAWQSSLAWLGFIPKHKLGFLWAHTSENWLYSSDFLPASKIIQGAYQLPVYQSSQLTILWQRREDTEAQTIQNSMKLNMEFSF